MNRNFFWPNQNTFNKIYTEIKFEGIIYLVNRLIREQRIFEKETIRLITFIVTGNIKLTNK